MPIPEFARHSLNKILKKNQTVSQVTKPALTCNLTIIVHRYLPVVGRVGLFMYRGESVIAKQESMLFQPRMGEHFTQIGNNDRTRPN